MKRVIKQNLIVITLLFISLNTINANSDINQELKNLKKEAIEVYKTKDYEKAYEKLSKIYMSALSDGKVNFLLGRSAYEIGRYGIALAAFERVQILDPSNSRNDLELGRTQYKLEMYEDAKINFEKVLKNPNLPETVRKNIELFLTKIESKLEKSFTTINANLGLIYDTNVNYGPYSNTSFNLPSKKGGLSIEFQGNLTNIYDVGEKNGLAVKNQVLLYHKEQMKNSLEEYNISYFSYAPGLIYQDYNTIYELNLLLDRMFLDGSDYLSAISLVPSFTHKLDPSNRISASLKLMDKSFKKTNESDKDSSNYELTLAYQKLMSGSFFTIKTFLAKEDKKRGTRVDIDYDSFGLNAVHTTQINSNYVASIEGGFKTKRYDDFSTVFNNKRVDDIYNIGLNISRKISTNTYLDSKINYERNFSNQNAYSYDKTSYGLYLNMTF